VRDGMTLAVRKQPVQQGSSYSRVRHAAADELANCDMLRKKKIN
jgi:hypothetical protein